MWILKWIYQLQFFLIYFKNHENYKIMTIIKNTFEILKNLNILYNDYIFKKKKKKI